MGKTGWKKEKYYYQPEWGQHASSQPSWSVWQGAWRSPRSTQQWPQKNQPKGAGKNRFPAYDADRPGQELIQPIEEVRKPATSAAPSLVQAVQTAVNYARKLDGKVNKLRSDIAAKDSQWKRYIVDLKAAFREERQRHANAVRRLQTELQDAVAQQQASHQQIGQAAATGLDPRNLLNAEDQEMWDAVMQEQAQTGPTGQVTSDGDFLRAIEIMQGHGGPAPTTPPHRTAREVHRSLAL
ncbi:hypothetical protein AK812_SmicGene300 [Symbiodinium microadriaticum]|uniref:Uncharacterized protein n=1 Tax=Symbiodinium microadriaticum TaxID=2951 RepID=A0A1Q9F6Y2_SYMMI|nr:hypothetical protein AK812_SmicGene300 [Symbiodinium microadriaticum]